MTTSTHVLSHPLPHSLSDRHLPRLHSRHHHSNTTYTHDCKNTIDFTYYLVYNYYLLTIDIRNSIQPNPNLIPNSKLLNTFETDFKKLEFLTENNYNQYRKTFIFYYIF